MRAFATIALPALLAAGSLQHQLHAQPVVESGPGAARAATTTAPASTLSTGVAKALDQLEKVLQPVKTTAPSETPVAKPANSKSRRPSPVHKPVAKPAAIPVRVPVSAPAPVYEDSNGVAVGMEREEVMRRFGPPALEVAGEPRKQMLTYVGKAGSEQVEMLDGKVVSVKPAVIKQAVFVLPH